MLKATDQERRKRRIGLMSKCPSGKLLKIRRDQITIHVIRRGKYGNGKLGVFRGKRSLITIPNRST
jgi:hypothetical protein